MSKFHPPVPKADGQAILRLSHELSAGRTDTVGALFASQGARSPLVVWDPCLADLNHPTLRSFLKAAHRERDPSGRILDRWADSAEFAAYSDWMMIVSPADGQIDFRYDHYGREIAAAYGQDMTGRLTSEIGGHIALFFSALYQAVSRRNQIVSSEHEPPKQVFVRVWRRLVVPLYDSQGAFSRLAVINLADNDLRAGLDVLPDAVLVVEPDGKVCFANRPAVELFGPARDLVPGMTLAEFTGLEIDLPKSPADAVLNRMERQVRHLVVRNAMIVALQLSIGATMYRDNPLFIVSARELVQ
ncbi:PAS domain-containing protein [Pseudoruegeria sp. SK021]|uniref:PAS domain-containing protein n=1 Tax=Pseudoruegeria sp. SK021 TaxID=1933035 RepID=UPI00111C7970|nr:PAS domain-containing protein [Pseudoruegeria sp. SK021]